MNEFEMKDYDGARNYADAIQKNADNIMGIFNSTDRIANELYGTNWTGAGSESANDRYKEIRKNYEGFYNVVVAMKAHIYAVTGSNEEADKLAGQNIAKV